MNRSCFNTPACGYLATCPDCEGCDACCNCNSYDEFEANNNGPCNVKPYVPDWCFEEGARICVCNDHEGFHNDSGACLRVECCGCAGFTDAAIVPRIEIDLADLTAVYAHDCANPDECPACQQRKATEERR